MSSTQDDFLVQTMPSNSLNVFDENHKAEQLFMYFFIFYPITFYHGIIGPLKRRPSLKQFESVLKEGYTFHLIITIIQALCGAFLSGCNIAVLNVPSLVIQNNCNLNMTQYSSFIVGLIGALSIGTIMVW